MYVGIYNLITKTPQGADMLLSFGIFSEFMAKSDTFCHLFHLLLRLGGVYPETRN
jgi:hypothetical protein